MNKFYFTLLILIVVGNGYSRGRGRGVSVSNNFNKGGEISSWIDLFEISSNTNFTKNLLKIEKGNIAEIENNSYKNLKTIPQISENLFFDSTGRFSSKISALPQNISNKHIESDSLGNIIFDTLNILKHFLYSEINANLSERVRFSLIYNGIARIWLNGKEITDTVGVANSGYVKYFDNIIKQGTNYLLVQLIPQGSNTIVVEAFPEKNISNSFEKRLNQISINEIKLDSKEGVLTGIFNYNIPVPIDNFSAKVTISTDSDSIGAKFATIDNISPDSLFGINYPSDFNGVLKLQVKYLLFGEQPLSTVKYLWSGNLDSALGSLKNAFNNLESSFANLKNQDKFSTFLSEGFFRWGRRYFSKISDNRLNENQIRELGYIQTGVKLFNYYQHKRRFYKGCEFPILMDSSRVEMPQDYYDNSCWLNYKYPECYNKPDRSVSAGYGFWVHLPKKAYRRVSKMPLILYLHDSDDGGNDISVVRSSGPILNTIINPKMKSIIITPRENIGNLWSADKLIPVINKFRNSGRVKKIYLTGEGSGGFAVWNLLTIIPNKITAAIPINSFAPREVYNLVDLPIWVFHGYQNKIVPVENAKKSLNALRECGGRKVNFSVFSENGSDIGEVIYRTKETYKWLFRQ